jgi:hypothetical protein
MYNRKIINYFNLRSAATLQSMGPTDIQSRQIFEANTVTELQFRAVPFLHRETPE